MNGYDLTLTSEKRGPVTVVIADGSADVYGAPRFRDYLVTLDREGRSLIVIDTDKVDYLDSTGLGVLVGAKKRAVARGGDVALVCTTRLVLTVLAKTALTKVFGVYATQDEAVAALAGDGK